MARTTDSASRFRELMDAQYRFYYGVGLHAARLGHRMMRWLKPRAVKLLRQLQFLWLKVAVRPMRCQWRKLRGVFLAIPGACRELVAAFKKKPLAVFPCLVNLGRRAIRHYREELLTLWRLTGPVVATGVLLITVAAWTNTEFCLALTYRGEDLGYIDNEGTYSQAASMAVARVVNVDNSFSVEKAPALSVTVQGRRNTLSNAELCDAILRTAGDSIAEASGLYVDGAFVGAMQSADELDNLLLSLQDGYYDKSDSSQRAEFVQDVDTVEGLFPIQSVVDTDSMRAKLTDQAVVEKIYTVQAGDTLSTIASKNDMTTSELRAMNPAYAKTDMVRVGDKLITQRPEAFLQVKVIKTITYTEKINYTTRYENNTDKDVTYSRVKVKGQEGSQDVVAEITYVDGMETDRTVISTVVTKEPVAKVVERGTKPVKSQSGGNVVVGDGISHGSMLWPVPICHNMSRGYRSGHYALDICNGPVTVRNKPAVASDGGVVVAAGWNGGYGNYVKIQHANGIATAYAHLNSISVVKGQTVSRGQQVGLIGSTGNSSGPHLHFEVIVNGVKVNPLRYVSP